MTQSTLEFHGLKTLTFEIHENLHEYMHTDREYWKQLLKVSHKQNIALYILTARNRLKIKT